MEISPLPFSLQPSAMDLPHPVPILKKLATGLLSPPRLLGSLRNSITGLTPVHEKLSGDHCFRLNQNNRIENPILKITNPFTGSQVITNSKNLQKRVKKYCNSKKNKARLSCSIAKKSSTLVQQ